MWTYGTKKQITSLFDIPQDCRIILLTKAKNDIDIYDEFRIKRTKKKA